mmetsp:Transcript_952/g.1186  ORF Transcript_952/g.1186 Transcript_952/m.1186 type:complete len:92 (-) Transcript_952:559-834(-)
MNYYIRILFYMRELEIMLLILNSQFYYCSRERSKSQAFHFQMDNLSQTRLLMKKLQRYWQLQTRKKERRRRRRIQMQNPQLRKKLSLKGDD